ncbi:lipase 3-like [Eupeodes corollae]|uniref:lipase 3-like n=1 Tax=Eupeodes corollae TaxID=290404 RepID=UPI00249097AC|nr:lipase 3-like [Eupeodes corollae]
MNLRLIVGLVLVALVATDSAFAGDITTESLIREAGYPFEEHTVETQDGYLLKLHRIPNNSQQKRGIALLMHGLSCSSADWVVLKQGKALAYDLADEGYDVWMGNFRGNLYSRNHRELNPDALLNSNFWDFTWHEMGTMDLPAMIDYIRGKTGEDKMHYFGHSQGTTTFFVMSSLNETYQSYIKSAHMITPLVYVEQLDSIFLEVANKVISLINPLATLAAGNTEFRPNGTITELAGAALCRDRPRELCSNILFLLTGFNEITVDPAILNDVLAITPAGASTKCFLHYFQVHDSNQFQQYDYGLLGNLRRYRNSKPPTYPLENVNVPVFLYWGEEDRLIHKPDIERLAAKLPNVKRVFGIKNGTHQYPMYSPFIKEQLYDLVVADVKSIE